MNQYLHHLCANIKSLVPITTKPSTIIVKLDSGASKHYFCPADSTDIANTQQVHNVHHVMEWMVLSCKSNSKDFYLSRQQSIDIPGMWTLSPILSLASLLLLESQFMDSGCTVKLEYHDATIEKGNAQILKG